MVEDVYCLAPWARGRKERQCEGMNRGSMMRRDETRRGWNREERRQEERNDEKVSVEVRD